MQFHTFPYGFTQFHTFPYGLIQFQSAAVRQIRLRTAAASCYFSPFVVNYSQMEQCTIDLEQRHVKLKFPGISCNYAFVRTEIGCLSVLQLEDIIL